MYQRQTEKGGKHRPEVFDARRETFTENRITLGKKRISCGLVVARLAVLIAKANRKKGPVETTPGRNFLLPLGGPPLKAKGITGVSREKDTTPATPSFMRFPSRRREKIVTNCCH